MSERLNSIPLGVVDFHWIGHFRSCCDGYFLHREVQVGDKKPEPYKTHRRDLQLINQKIHKCV